MSRTNDEISFCSYHDKEFTLCAERARQELNKGVYAFFELLESRINDCHMEYIDRVDKAEIVCANRKRTRECYGESLKYVGSRENVPGGGVRIEDEKAFLLFKACMRK